MTDIPTNEPLELVAGDTWKWTRTLSDYPASVWTLNYHLHSSSAKIMITAAASSDDHAVVVAKATTAAYVAGDYTWQAYADNGSERYLVDSGILTVLPDLSVASVIDRRSHARKVLAAIEAVIETRASKDQESYTIDGRSLGRTPIPDLIVLRDRYKAEVVGEERAARIAAGLSHSGNIKVRF